MNLLIFRTDIKTKRSVNTIKSIFNKHPTINDWSIDTNDIDNVLRIEASNVVTEKVIINLIEKQGFYCEVLE